MGLNLIMSPHMADLRCAAMQIRMAAGEITMETTMATLEDMTADTMAVRHPRSHVSTHLLHHSIIISRCHRNH